ncbi:MGH1-like glycoside hydrolase domain-containing protein [Paenibacillus cymbidii]|uniref:MGH1-like glycoside hydrolase domain-containing protein n=1 Tax=Paenibacillus cymbidii TaxID=1639034 RepID=UPI001081A83D|nr:trehalase family glycosidase [Paenibacillus cymbidii]
MRNLKQQVFAMGKPEWRSMLEYTVELHRKCTREPEPPFSYPWEEIGTGYCFGPAFGHIDLTHATLDTLRYQPIHAKNQLLNYLSLQTADGLIPGCIWFRGGDVKWSTAKGHPPFWPVAVQDFHDLYEDFDLIRSAYLALVRQIGWFETNRKADNEGYYYIDLWKKVWESGVDDGIRYDNITPGPYACVDATAHVYQMYVYAAKWANLLDLPAESGKWQIRAKQLAEFIRGALFDEETALFHDSWSVGQPHSRRLTFEGMWPMMVGAATAEQANRVIDENLLNPDRFFTAHPVPTIALEDPAFELRMWRGPSWNSITYWVARGCTLYGRNDAALAILERAIDHTAVKFAETGTLWEFYHPHGGLQAELQRKPYTAFNQPCREYMGHNPMIAMTDLWASLN